MTRDDAVSNALNDAAHTVTNEEMMREFIGSLTASGFAIVPIEPTEEVLAVLHSKIRIQCDPRAQTASIMNDKALWRSMIVAAQEPPK